MTDNYSRGETGSHGHKTIIQTQTGRAEVCQVKHLHALEQLKIAHGGKQVKEFQFQYSRQPALCVSNEENWYIITNTNKMYWY